MVLAANALIDHAAANKRADFLLANRAYADKVTGFNASVPPSNNEIEIIGIECRIPEGRIKDNYVQTRDRTNPNNYSCLIRYKHQIGRIGYHMPVIIPFVLIDSHLRLMSP